MKRGFSLIELMVVLGILAVVFVFSVSAFSLFVNESDLDSSTNNIISVLKLARNKALASEEGDRYGVYFDTSSSPERYILFKGSGYDVRDVSYDDINTLPTSINLTNISFNNSNNEVVFNRLKGDTENYGSFFVYLSSKDKMNPVYIYSSGEISLIPELLSGPGRIEDSRHVHFELGWDMAGSSALKFDFINAGQIEQINISDYFTPLGFDWSGKIVVNENLQEFRIHTHELGINSLLCIHRDRNKEKNNEEVYIYIIQDGVEKFIAHYNNDEYATVNKGSYVFGEMEKQ